MISLLLTIHAYEEKDKYVDNLDKKQEKITLQTDRQTYEYQIPIRIYVVFHLPFPLLKENC